MEGQERGFTLCKIPAIWEVEIKEDLSSRIAQANS
jgi:hypothetical protein